MYVYGSATSALTLHTLSSFLCNVPVFMLPKAHVSGCVNTVQYEVCVCVWVCVFGIPCDLFLSNHTSNVSEGL